MLTFSSPPVIRRLFFALFFLFIADGLLLSGDTTAPQVKPLDYSQQPLSVLLQLRDDMVKQIEIKDRELTDLKTQLYWVTEAARLREKLKQPDIANVPAAELATLRQQVKDAENNAGGHSAQETNELIRVKDGELSDLKKKREDIESAMSIRLNLEKPKQDFKIYMSISFAVLVGLVIIGFFIIANRDEYVRREIFSGQSGIQFITLFSLVIAIILFGITEVLEGKELSALLGGLSGYILGRSGSKNASDPAAK